MQTLLFLSMKIKEVFKKNGKWEIRNEKWEMGNEKWEMRNEKWGL